MQTLFFCSMAYLSSKHSPCLSKIYTTFFMVESWLFEDPGVTHRLCLKNITIKKWYQHFQRCWWCVQNSYREIINVASSINIKCSCSCSLVNISNVLKLNESKACLLIFKGKCNVECDVMLFSLYMDFLVNVMMIPHFFLKGLPHSRLL